MNIDVVTKPCIVNKCTLSTSSSTKYCDFMLTRSCMLDVEIDGNAEAVFCCADKQEAPC